MLLKWLNRSGMRGYATSPEGNMQLRHIRYLLAVAEHGNFTRAAEALHVSQPTLLFRMRN